jgi:GAF domain-containing protein
MDRLTQLLTNSDFDKAADAVLSVACEKFDADQADLYLFSPRKGKHELHRGYRCKSHLPLPVGQIADEKVSAESPDSDVGYVLVQGKRTQADPDDVALIQSCIHELFRRRFVDIFFTEIRQSVDFADADTYYEKIAELLSKALSMDMVAIRYLIQRSQRPISTQLDQLQNHAFYSYEHGIVSEDLNFDDEIPEPFQEAIDAAKESLRKNREQEPLYEIVEAGNPRYAFLDRDEVLRNVKCFVIFPIVSKDHNGKAYVYGLISCASSHANGFGDLQKNAVKTSMQLIGVAISNHVSYLEVRRLTGHVYEQIFSATALELAQSAKHQLVNIEHELALGRKRLEKIHPRAGEEEKFKDICDDIQKTEAAISDATRRLKFNASPTEKLSEKPIAILDVWREAVDLTANRLEQARIKVTDHLPPSGGAFKDHLFRDWLKEAFLNLIFNSIQAFTSRPKHNRWIRLDLREDHQKSLMYHLDYSDSAGGLNMSKIHFPKN